jgi:hypothetical protein
MPRPRLPIPLYPTVLGFAFVFELFVMSGISPFSSMRVFAVAVIVPVALTFAGRALMGDRDRGALAAALAVLAIMTGVDLLLGILVLVAIGLLLAERYLLPERYQTIRWPRITMIMSRLTAILALAVGLHAVQQGTPGLVARALATETPLRPSVTAAASASDPDIYVILVDGRAREDVLTEHFGVDGSAMTEALEARGFSVADRSRANYTITAETLASMFNMAHLADVPRMQGLLDGTDQSVKGIVLREVINDNPVFRTLRDRGYFIEAISSGYEEVSLREADRFVDTGELNEVEVGMLRRTTIGDVLDLVARDAVSSQFRSRIQGAFDALVDDSGRPTDRPVFVFDHVPSPHPPWVFHADGSPRTAAHLEAIYADTPQSTGLTLPELRAAYGEQVIDTDRRLLDALDRLDAAIARRGRPAVIVTFSDHGSWVDADGGDIRLRFKNLLAVKATAGTVAFDDDMTTVNVFGSLFSQLFGMAWHRQPDTTYRFGARDVFELVAVDDPDAADVQ